MLSNSEDSSGLAVGVWIRVRPLIDREIIRNARECLAVTEHQNSCAVTVGRDRQFTFDHAYDAKASQHHVYQSCVSPLVESCFDGYNATVLAYGQTGSGKTYTMGTGEQFDEHQLGVAPRVIRHIFQGIQQRSSNHSFTVRAQFLEIYNEEVKDLIRPDIPPRNIQIRDAGDGTMAVIGASEIEVVSAEELMGVLQQGLAARATGSTHVNEQSSRSHAIFSIMLEQQVLQVAGAGSAAWSVDGPAGSALMAGETRSAKLHLVDLAGSERTKHVRASLQGARFKETVNINQGLLALGNVISALGDERRRGSHVPYRESKLTRLLQDSLGGNSRTAMIACVSCADTSMEETLNTLKYANRARNIRNKPVVNRGLQPTLSPLRGAVQVAQLEVLKALVSQLPRSSLARGLPLQELNHLDLTDGGACLAVLVKMRNALAGWGGPDTVEGADQSSVGDSRQLQQLLDTCIRVLTGMLQGMAEMERDGRLDQQARMHICRSLDTSTLKLLPTVHSALRASLRASLASTNFGGVAPLPLDLSSSHDGSASGRERELEDRVRQLEEELACTQNKYQEAKDDLARDEIIFANTLRDLQDARHAVLEGQQRLQEAEQQHSKQVESLQQQVEALRTPRSPVRHVRRNSQTSGKGSSRRSSHSNRDTEQGPDGEAQRLWPGGAGDGGDEDEVIYDEELLSYISDTDYAERDRLALLESDVALREELANVLKQKGQAEAERACIERQALAQRSSYDAAKAQLEQQLQSLSESIQEHQHRIEALQVAEREARELAHRFEERVTTLESEIQAREQTESQLLAELQFMEGTYVQRSAEERHVLRSEYEQRISETASQVAALRRELAAQQHKGAVGRADKGHVAALEAEVERMRLQQAEVRKALAERDASYAREIGARAKDVQFWRKQAEDYGRRIRELKKDNDVQQELLLHKQQEVAAAQQRARESAKRASGGGALATASAAAQGGRPGTAPAARSSSHTGRDTAPAGGLLDQQAGPGRPAGRPQQQHAMRVSDEDDTGTAVLTGEQCAMLMQLMLVAGRCVEIDAKLIGLATRKDELLAQRTELIDEQSQLQLRISRRSEQLVADIAKAEQELADLMQRAPSPRFDSPASQPSEQTPGGAAADDWVALQQRIADVSYTKSCLEGRLKSGRLLGDEEQQRVDDIDDHLESIETELDYVGHQISDRGTALVQAERAHCELQAGLRTLPPAALRAALVDALSSLGSSHTKIRRLENALSASRDGAMQHDALLDESLASLSEKLAVLQRAVQQGTSASSGLREALSGWSLRELAQFLKLNQGEQLTDPYQAEEAAGPGPGTQRLDSAATAAAAADAAGRAFVGGPEGVWDQRQRVDSGSMGETTGAMPVGHAPQPMEYVTPREPRAERAQQLGASGGILRRASLDSSSSATSSSTKRVTWGPPGANNAAASGSILDGYMRGELAAPSQPQPVHAPPPPPPPSTAPPLQQCQPPHQHPPHQQQQYTVATVGGQRLHQHPPYQQQQYAVAAGGGTGPQGPWRPGGGPHAAALHAQARPSNSGSASPDEEEEALIRSLEAGGLGLGPPLPASYAGGYGRAMPHAGRGRGVVSCSSSTNSSMSSGSGFAPHLHSHPQRQAPLPHPHPQAALQGRPRGPAYGLPGPGLMMAGRQVHHGPGGSGDGVASTSLADALLPYKMHLKGRAAPAPAPASAAQQRAASASRPTFQRDAGSGGGFGAPGGMPVSGGRGFGAAGGPGVARPGSAAAGSGRAQQRARELAY